VAAGTGVFSPNGDGRGETITVTARASEAVAWSVDFASGDGTVLATVSGEGEDIAATWDGLEDGSPVPDGAYDVSISARDPWGNPDAKAVAKVGVDTVPPDLALGEAAAPALFTPNGDGVTDSTRIGLQTNEPGTAAIVVKDGDGATVDAYDVTVGEGAAAATWDGRTTGGTYVPDGGYSIQVAMRDLAGNQGPWHVLPVDVFKVLARVRSSAVAFYPQDGDAYAKTAGLSIGLSGPATVTWTIRDLAGNVVRSRYADAALAAGSYGFTWDGRDDAGRYVAKGVYLSTVTATDGTLVVTQRSSITADAFRIAVSDTTPSRGQRVSVTVFPAEPLAKAPTVAISMPGHATWSVSMVRVSSTAFRAYVTLKTGGSAGTISFRANGYDGHKRYQWSRLSLPLN
jgi:flagellar hook assembly protein FlgD